MRVGLRRRRERCRRPPFPPPGARRSAQAFLERSAFGAEQHERSRAWLEAVLSGSDLVRFAWPTLWAFVRIATSPRVFDRPLSASEARMAIASWLTQPVADIVEPGDRHWEILGTLLDDGQTVGPLVMDAVLAAIALEHGATLYTTDRDFSRFDGLKRINPLVANP